MLLALLACALIVAFRASVSALIPLYCIGVFLSFTLSQAGMTRRWWTLGRRSPADARGWIPKMALNAVGAFSSAVVVVVFSVTKFHEGAWIVLVVIPLLVTLFFAIHRHYRHLSARLSLEHYGSPPRAARHRVILPISSVHQGTLATLSYARRLSSDVTAVHVSIDASEARELHRKWALWGEGVRLVILESPYRLLLEPLLSYSEEIAGHRQPNETITIVVPQLVPERGWHNLLHAQTAMLLRLALMSRRGIVITNVPYHPGP